MQGCGRTWHNLSIQGGERLLMERLHGSVKPGSCLALVGHSGCGKTTLLETLAGFHPPATGNMTWLGESHYPTPVEIGFIAQDLALPAALTALEAVSIGRLGQTNPWQTLWGLPRAWQKAAWIQLVEVGLAEQAHTPVGKLSGGEQQRVAIARCLFQQPRIIFADEPVAHLDAANTTRVLDILRTYAHDHHAAVIVSLHQRETVTALGAEVLDCDANRKTHEANLPATTPIP